MTLELRDERGAVYARIADSPEAIAAWRAEKHRERCVCGGSLSCADTRSRKEA